MPGALVIVLAIQLIPVTRTNPPIESEIPASPEVRSILRRACYDCHSHETKWPWYSKVAPVSWLIASDVEQGREDLNFSIWGQYNSEQQAKKLKECREEINEREMPPRSYVLMHGSAALSAEERETLYKWSVDLTER
jgi:hypothetical protein